jgi:hypothetical protein
MTTVSWLRPFPTPPRSEAMRILACLLVLRVGAADAVNR